MHSGDDYMTLTEAAKVTPGRPSTSCLWRWCRRGVLARSGRRVRLKHVRLGGRIFTTAAWLDAFGKTLAEADAAHFDTQQPVISEQAGSPRPMRAPRRRATRHLSQRRRAAHEQAERELKEAGL